MAQSELQAVLWDYFIEAVRRKVDAKEMSRRKISQLLGVHHSAVARWYSGERGESHTVGIGTILERLALIGHDTETVMMHLEPEHAAYLVGFLHEHSHLMPKLTRVLLKGGRYLDHLVSTIEMLDSQIEKDDEGGDT